MAAEELDERLRRGLLAAHDTVHCRTWLGPTKGLSGMVPFACIMGGTHPSYHPTASVAKV